jgi:hypothetical protein
MDGDAEMVRWFKRDDVPEANHQNADFGWLRDHDGGDLTQWGRARRGERWLRCGTMKVQVLGLEKSRNLIQKPKHGKRRSMACVIVTGNRQSPAIDTPAGPHGYVPPSLEAYSAVPSSMLSGAVNDMNEYGTGTLCMVCM